MLFRWNRDQSVFPGLASEQQYLLQVKRACNSILLLTITT